LLLIGNQVVTHPGCTNAKRMRTFTEHGLTAAVQKTTQRCLRYQAAPVVEYMAETACLHGLKPSMHNIPQEI